MMNAEEIRLKQNPILRDLLLGMGQGGFIGEKLFPCLPSTLSSFVLNEQGTESFKKYNLRRAPGAATKRVNIKYNGKLFSIAQRSVEISMPRELFREADESRRLQVENYLDVSRIAMTTIKDILAIDYELTCAELATAQESYAIGNSQDLSGSKKWSSLISTPVSDINLACETIKKKTGKRPNLLTLSPAGFTAIRTNLEVRDYLPSKHIGVATIDQLKEILGIAQIVISEAIWCDESDHIKSIWGNNAILAYTPEIAKNNESAKFPQSAFGLTSIIDGHPFSETPYFNANEKSWIYGATYERQPSIVNKSSAFIFRNIT